MSEFKIIYGNNSYQTKVLVDNIQITLIQEVRTYLNAYLGSTTVEITFGNYSNPSNYIGWTELNNQIKENIEKLSVFPFIKIILKDVDTDAIKKDF